MKGKIVIEIHVNRGLSFDISLVVIQIRVSLFSKADDRNRMSIQWYALDYGLLKRKKKREKKYTKVSKTSYD